MNTERTSSRLPEDRLWQPVTAKWFFVVFGACLAYAVARYHGSGEVAWTHFPLFILNKIISLAAIIFIACSYVKGWLAPAGWLLGLPPISLWAAAAAAIPLVAKLWQSFGKKGVAAR